MKSARRPEFDLSRLRRRAAWGIHAEFLLRAIAPACGILAAYIVAALFGFGNSWAWLGVLLLALLALGYGLSRLRRPAAEEIDRRIERASGLRHRPLSMLEDAPENDGELTAAIWQIHQRRIAASLLNAGSGRLFVDAVAHDPLALRGLLLLLLLAAAIIAGPQAVPRIAGAFAFPKIRFAGPSVTAWMTPPSYTGAPPLVLQPGGTYSALAGSTVTVVVNGEADPAMVLGGKSLDSSELAQNSFRADMVLTASAKLRIGPWWRRLATWQFNVVPPDGPAIGFSRPFVLNRQLIIRWHARDRYGLAALTALLRPVGQPGAAPESFPLALAGTDPQHEGGVAKPDIGDSPFAGLRVTLWLTGRNLAGVAGSTAPVTITLPPPALTDQTALALAALRQKLALTPKRGGVVGDALAKLSERPLSRITAAADVQMAVLAQALRNGEIAGADAQSLLDQLEHEVELGPDYQPAQAFAAAARALEQALRQAADGKKLDANRLQNMLAALQSALAQHLQAIDAKNSAASGSGSMNAGDLNRMAEQIAQDEAAGQTAKAAAELRQLEQILADLQSARPMSAADAARRAIAGQAAQELAGMTKAESGLLDQTTAGNAAPATQAALQAQLSAMQKLLAKARIPLPGLGQAAAAMGTAQNALAQNDEPTAASAEGAAIQALQKAAAALSAARQGMSFDAGQSGGASDPFENGTNGAPDESIIPGLLPSSGNPAGAIERQIIKNDSNPALPNATHQYYHRLLDQDGP